MSEPSPAPRRKGWKLLLLSAAFCVTALGLLAWYVSTARFQDVLRQRLVTFLEKTTGGRVEIGEFHTIPLRLRVDVRSLTIHGREASDQVPYLRVDRLQAELKIISLLGKEVGLHSLALEHPVVHVIVYPDGSTNQPEPKISRASDKGTVEQFFALSVSHLEVHGGELLWEENKIPMNLDARDVSLALGYSFLRQQYETQVTVGRASTQFPPNPSLAWRADAAMAVYRDHADITALNVVSGKSEIHFSGRVEDFRQAKVIGGYRGVAELAELAPALGKRAVRKGTASFEGKGFWSAGDFSTDGSVQLRDFDWADNRLMLPTGRFACAFSLTPQRLRLSSIKIGLLGGEVAGEVDVANWRSVLDRDPPPKKKKSAGGVPMGSLQRGKLRLQLAGFSSPVPAPRKKRPAGRVPTGPQRGVVRLQLSGFPLATAIQAISSKKFPLDRLHLNGTASGPVEIQWVGSIRDSELRGSLKIAPPPRVLPGEVPVRGEVQGVYRGSSESLSLNEFHLLTPSSEITAKGELAATTAVRLSFASHDLREWQPLMQAIYGPEKLPFVIQGFALFNGSASGRLSALQLNGNLEVYDFDTLLPSRANQPRRSVHWDSLTTTIQYSNRGLAARNSTLIHGMTVAHFDASTALTAGVAGENSPFTLHLNAQHADVAEIARLAGLDYDVAGTADLTVHASGTPAHAHGEGHIEIHNGRAFGAPVAFVRSDLRLADGELQFNNIDANVHQAGVKGSAAVSTSSDAFRANLAVVGLDLASFPKLQVRGMKVDGLADFTLRASGTREQPVLEAHLHLRDLAFDKERAGDFVVDAVTHGRRVAIEAHSEFEKPELNIKGEIGLEHDLPADLDLTFRRLDVDSLLRMYLGERVTGHSSLAGTVRLRGPLRSPRDLKLAANLDSVEAEVAHVQLRNAEPIRIEVADRIARIEALHLAGSGTDFTAHGTAQLGESRALDLHLEGTVNVALLPALSPNLSARGMLGLNLSATGTVSRPELQGRLTVKDSAISHNDLPSGLSELNGVLLFDQGRVQIESLTGKTGGGTVSLTGSGSYQNGVFGMDLVATAREVRLRYPPGVSSTANADLRLTGTSASALLSGEVVITKLAVTRGFDFGSYLEKNKQSVVVSKSDTLGSRVKLDVHLATTPELQMQTAIAKLSGDADLRLRGTVERPVILGRAEILEGEVSFNGTRYRVERGDVTFSNPAKTEPVADLQLATRVRDYDITVNLSGDVSKPNSLKATWRSEPPLPEADVIALLALGRTREESAAQQSGGAAGFGGDASSLLIGEALNTAVGSRVQRLFGVSRIKIDPQGLISTTNVVRGPQVTIEQQVASNVTITYSTNVSVASQQIIQVEYNVTRNISVVALRDQNGVVSFDVKIRQRKK